MHKNPESDGLFIVDPFLGQVPENEISGGQWLNDQAASHGCCPCYLRIILFSGLCRIFLSRRSENYMSQSGCPKDAWAC